MKSISRKKGIQYGTVTLPEVAFEPRNTKIRVTTFIDLDILDALKTEARMSGAKYQSLMNQKLRDSIFGKRIDPFLIDQIKSIVRQELEKK